MLVDTRADVNAKDPRDGTTAVCEAIRWSTRDCSATTQFRRGCQHDRYGWQVSYRRRTPQRRRGGQTICLTKIRGIAQPGNCSIAASSSFSAWAHNHPGIVGSSEEKTLSIWSTLIVAMSESRTEGVLGWIACIRAITIATKVTGVILFSMIRSKASIRENHSPRTAQLRDKCCPYIS
jgi:hypothetical protein